MRKGSSTDVPQSSTATVTSHWFSATQTGGHGRAVGALRDPLEEQSRGLDVHRRPGRHQGLHGVTAGGVRLDAPQVLRREGEMVRDQDAALVDNRTSRSALL